jgi:hypothetical protein
MKGQEITEAERICGKLLERIRDLNRPAGPVLGPAGFVPLEFFDDLRKLPSHLWECIEEYAYGLKEAARTGKLGLEGCDP